MFFLHKWKQSFFSFLVTGFQTASTLFASSFCLSFFPFFFFCFFLVFQECSLHHKQFFLTSVVPLRRYLSLFSLRFFFFCIVISLRLHCVRWSLLPTEHIERASWGVQKQLLVERVDRCTFVYFFFFLFLLRRSRLLLEPISQFFFIIIKERALWLTPCSSFFFFFVLFFFFGGVGAISVAISA